MADSQDVNALKRRGRRRLVGAIALVLVAVIVLPWIFDPEPIEMPPVSVRIPSEDESAFKPKPLPQPPLAVAPKPEPPAPDAAPKPAPADKPAPEAVPATRAVQAERARAEAALANVRFVVPVGAYAEPDRVLGQLKAAKIPYYTEPVPTAKGTVIRVRAGPFASREAAEQAHRQIKALGFKPGAVMTLS